MDPILTVAVRAARTAGDILREAAGRVADLAVENKAPRDYVTEVDRASEASILRTIRAAFPDHGVLAEESGAHHGDEHVWIVDPLDGTTNFIHGMPHWCVSIAVRRADRIVHAAILDPVRDELFAGSRGAGATLNGNRLRVSDRASVDGALLGTGIPYRGAGLARWPEYARILSAFVPRAAGIRRPGSAALDLAYVAAGRFDGFWEFDLRAWDLAAGALLIAEAGGLVTDPDGGDGFLESGDIVAAGPRLHAEMLSEIAAARR